MATSTTKPEIVPADPLARVGVPAWPGAESAPSDISADSAELDSSPRPTQLDALQALLAFSALHEQIRRRKTLAGRHGSFDTIAPSAEFETEEQFVLDEVLQLVAERAVAITGADGLAIALAENDEIVLRAAAGTVRPDVGARIDRDSAFSGACFRAAQIVNCDDTETDARVNLQACRRLGARSMVAVPLCGRRRVIGLLEAFSSWPFGFNDSDIRNLSLLAELVVGALKPEDEDRFAQSAQIAATQLDTIPGAPVVAPALPHPAAALFEAPAPAVEAKPLEVAPVSTAPIQAASAAEVVTAPETESQFVTERPTEEPAPRESGTALRRPVMLFLLVGIVVIVAFAAGVWFKIGTAQLGGTVVRTTSSRSAKPSNGDAPQAGASSAASSPSTDEMSATNQSSNPPATAQEVANFPRINGIRHWSSSNSSTVVLDLEDQVQYEAHRLTGPDRIYFDLHDTQLPSELMGKSIEVGDTLLSRIRVAQPVPGMTRIVLETRSNPNFSVSLEPNPYRLVVEVSKIGASPKGAINLFPNTSQVEKSLRAIVIPPPTKEDIQLRARVPKLRIVVDAGHGGWDLGTVGRGGLLEKDLVLEISQRLGKLLETRLGMNVVYTRQDDNYIALDERAGIANRAQADLFVSVHANYSDLPSARGVETYYTNFFSAPGSKETDPRTSSAVSPVAAKGSAMLSPADLHERIEQSRRLAASVQRSLYGTLSAQNPGLRDRGIKEAGFVVLTESSMPGILAEVSFVSSPTDEQKLRSDGYREQIAEALYKGIARYAANSRGVKVASAGK